MSDDTKPTTRSQIEFDPSTLERARDAASVRGLTLHRLVNLAVDDFLGRLLPADEIVWTRDEVILRQGDFVGTPAVAASDDK